MACILLVESKHVRNVSNVDSSETKIFSENLIVSIKKMGFDALHSESRVLKAFLPVIFSSVG